MKLNELLDKLSGIALLKSMLPSHLRGWANALGLYVQERRVGNRVRLQAGGRFRSCLDAWKQSDGHWDVRKLDKDTWKKNYQHLVEPTEEIVDFLQAEESYFGDLDRDGREALNNAIQHYKNTGNWLGLPEEIIHKQKARILDASAAEIRDVLRNNPDNALYHMFLGKNYDAQGKLDEAIAEFREALRIDPNNAETHFNLGNAYQAQGKFREAIECYQAFIEVATPNDALFFKQAEENILALKQRI